MTCGGVASRLSVTVLPKLRVPYSTWHESDVMPSLVIVRTLQPSVFVTPTWSNTHETVTLPVNQPLQLAGPGEHCGTGVPGWEPASGATTSGRTSTNSSASRVLMLMPVLR